MLSLSSVVQPPMIHCTVSNFGHESTLSWYLDFCIGLELDEIFGIQSALNLCTCMNPLRYMVYISLGFLNLIRKTLVEFYQIFKSTETNPVDNAEGGSSSQDVVEGGYFHLKIQLWWIQDFSDFLVQWMWSITMYNTKYKSLLLIAAKFSVCWKQSIEFW